MKNMNSHKEIIKNYLLQNHIKFNNIEIKPLSKGLSNLLYEVNVDDRLYFLKIFGTLKNYNIINRKFENLLLFENSKQKLCPKIYDSDNETYRIEEYISDINTPSDSELFNNILADSLLEKLIIFQKSLNDSEAKEYADHNVFNLLQKVHSHAKRYFYDSIDGKHIPLNFTSKIKSYLDEFDTKLNSLRLGTSRLILSHNDLHMGNIAINSEGKVIRIFDYEYACFNVIGFDIANYCIESFFDLEYPRYPYYRLKGHIDNLVKDEKYYLLFLKYITMLKDLEYVSDDESRQFQTKEYYFRVLGLCSQFWFYMSLMFIDYDGYANKQGFSYIDYSLDRISIYEKTIKLI
jgi:thiamine kinase-like enzyme